MRILLIKLINGLLAGILAVTMFAVQAADLSIRTDYPLTKLTKNVQVIHGPNEEVSKQNQGFRNNPVIVTTSKGVVVIDPGSSVYIGEMIVNKVKTLTNKPIIAVFNTHGHGDHWLGNDGIRRHYPQAVIYGHGKMIQDIAGGDGDVWIKAINNRSEGAIEGTKIVAPNMAIKDGDRIKIGNITFRVYDVGAAHSHSDIMLELQEEKVFVFGDALRVKNLSPFMSSFSSNLKALKLGENRKAKVYIPGHGQSGGKAIINEYRGFITTLKSEVSKYFEQGLSDFEMKPKIITTMAKYKSWSGFDENIGRLINLAYMEVEKESF